MVPRFPTSGSFTKLCPQLSRYFWCGFPEVLVGKSLEVPGCLGREGCEVIANWWALSGREMGRVWRPEALEPGGCLGGHLRQGVCPEPTASYHEGQAVWGQTLASLVNCPASGHQHLVLYTGSRGPWGWAVGLGDSWLGLQTCSGRPLRWLLVPRAVGGASEPLHRCLHGMELLEQPHNMAAAGFPSTTSEDELGVGCRCQPDVGATRHHTDPLGFPEGDPSRA